MLLERLFVFVVFSIEYNSLNFFAAISFFLIILALISYSEVDMLNIFNYTDFRKYLTDYYEDKKKENERLHEAVCEPARCDHKGCL